MSTAALLTIAETRKQPTPTDEWIQKMWCILYGQWNTTRPLKRMKFKKKKKKNNEILPFATRWMDLEGITLNEMSDRERQTLYDITYMWNLKSATN